MKLAFYIKQIVKMAVQHVYLPILYFFHSRGKVQKGLVIFADAHHNTIPFSMEKMHDEVSKLENIEIREMYLDFQNCGIKTLVLWLNCFMKVYGKAEYVFICDNFLPVSSCKKRAETKVIQLWHSGGLLKKAGYDTADSVPEIYKGNVFRNYDLLTASAECCVEVLSRSFLQPEGVVKATGISRSDVYFDEEYNHRCCEEFYAEYPYAKGKKIVLWVPTFRGNAADPKLEGEQELDKAFERLSDCFLVKKLHPHFESKHADKISCKIPSERLLPVADLLITDYSSIVFDYLAYKKPFVLFAPDLEEYQKNHGFYLPYDSYPATVAKTSGQLIKAVEYELSSRDRSQLEECYNYHMGACDGHSTDRILRLIGLKNKSSS